MSGSANPAERAAGGGAAAEAMVIVDTSVLVDALTGPRRSATALRTAIESGERLLVPTLVLYEWWSGPRKAAELEAQEALFPSEGALAFGVEEARAAVGLYRSVSTPRDREVDLAIAAHASVRGASVWTLNAVDFEDLPGVELFGDVTEP